MALAFAAPREPIAHGLSQTLRIDAETGFQQAFANGECVVKLGLSGEVAHTKIVQPIDGAGTPLRAQNNFHTEFSGVHGPSIVHRRGPVELSMSPDWQYYKRRTGSISGYAGGIISRGRSIRSQESLPLGKFITGSGEALGYSP